MARPLWTALLVAVLVSWACGARAAPVPEGMPPLGDERYTVHFHGTLGAAIADIRAVTGWTIELPRDKHVNGQWVEGHTDVPVALDFDKATFGEIVVAICAQAGMVVDGSSFALPLAATPRLKLRVGNMKFDPRPTVDLGDYLLRVALINVLSSRSLEPMWGDGKPKRSGADELEVWLQVWPKTRQASVRYAGVGAATRAVTDDGQVLETKAWKDFEEMAGHRVDEPDFDFHMPFSGCLGYALRLGKATKLARLEGALKVYGEVQQDRIAIPPDSAGGMFTSGEASVAVQRWETVGDHLEVDADALVLVPPGNQTPGGGVFPGLPRAVFTAKDGTELPYTVGHQSGQRGIQGYAWPYRIEYRVPLGPEPGGKAPPPEVDSLQVTFYRHGAERKSIPFVFHNVPLP